MFVLGHLGITAFAVRVADEKADLRPALLLALLPDLVDKPLELLLPEVVNGNTRAFGHTLLASLLLLRRPLWWACYAGHFTLDRVRPEILLWPLLGPFPAPARDLAAAREAWRYNLGGEALGLTLLLVTLAMTLRSRGSARRRR